MKFTCSIYNSRPGACVGYPWNITNKIFADCQFLNKEKTDLLTMDELRLEKTDNEISDYCVGCGKCCFFGPAACDKLVITGEDEKT